MYKDHMNLSLYRHDVEANAIADAIQPEFDRQYSELEFNFRQQWIIISDEPGIEEWENIYMIRPNLHTQTLEDRRAVVHRIHNINPPYTIGWLLYWFEHHKETPIVRYILNEIALTLELWVYTIEVEAALEARRMLIQIIPANIGLHIYRTWSLPPIEPAVMGIVAFNFPLVQHKTRPFAYPAMDIRPAVASFVSSNFPLIKHTSRARAFPQPKISVWNDAELWDDSKMWVDDYTKLL